VFIAMRRTAARLAEAYVAGLGFDDLIGDGPRQPIASIMTAASPARIR
jgi:hypothetical protein